MSKYFLLSVVFAAMGGLTARSEEPKNAYQDSPQYKYLLEARKIPFGFHHADGRLDWTEEIIEFGPDEGGLFPDYLTINESPDFEPERHFIAGTRANVDIPHYRDVVWQWENDMAFHEQRVEVLKELARNFARVRFDAERGRLLELSLNGARGSSRLPASRPSPNHIPVCDSLLVRVVEAFPEIRSLELEAIGPEVTDKGISEISHLKYLQKLTIEPLSRYYCNVTDAAMPHIAQCKNLLSLTMRNMHITDKGIESLSSLPGLTRLYLTSLTLTPQSFVSIAKLPRIRLITINFHNFEPLRQRPHIYGQEVLEAISSLNGRLEILDTPMLGPDMLDAVCQIKSLRQLLISFSNRGYNRTGAVHYSFDARSVRIEYGSLLRYMKNLEEQYNWDRVNWLPYENYQPQKE